MATNWKAHFLSVFAALIFAASPSAKASESLDKALKETLENCTKVRLPNTQAHTSGSEATNDQQDYELRRAKTSKVFHSEKGIRFLDGKLKTETDSLNKVCILQVISESRLPAAQPILNRYKADKDDAVKSEAEKGLSELEKSLKKK